MASRPGLISWRTLFLELCSSLCDIHELRRRKRDFKIDPNDEAMHQQFNAWYYTDFVPTVTENDRYIDLSPPHFLTGFNQGLKFGLEELTLGILHKDSRTFFKIDVSRIPDENRRIKSLTREVAVKLYDRLSPYISDFTW